LHQPAGSNFKIVVIKTSNKTCKFPINLFTGDHKNQTTIFQLIFHGDEFPFLPNKSNILKSKIKLQSNRSQYFSAFSFSFLLSIREKVAVGFELML
jgi:hypothetical protein